MTVNTSPAPAVSVLPAMDMRGNTWLPYVPHATNEHSAAARWRRASAPANRIAAALPSLLLPPPMPPPPPLLLTPGRASTRRKAATAKETAPTAKVDAI